GFFERLEKSNGNYVLETAAGVRFEYNNDLRIDRIVDLNDNKISFTYDPDSGLLIIITDPVGKQYHLEYDEMNRIRVLQDNTADRKINFYYGDNGDLEEVDLLLQPDLVTGIDYRYLGANYPFELQHNLTEIIRFTGESV